jgi:hypothetical protein
MMEKAIKAAGTAKKNTVAEKLKQAQRDRVAKGRPSVLGVPRTKANRAIEEEYGSAYQ